MSGRLAGVRWIDLPREADARGTLVIVGHAAIPFSIARMFYVHGVPPGGERGGHAHRVTEQFVIAIAGAFSLDLTDGRETRSFRLDSPGRGVYIPPMVWDRLYDFGSGAVCLVLASTQYAEADYIRDWTAFQREGSAARG
jgi:hypothetical protein